MKLRTKPPSGTKPGALPSREQLLAFIREHAGKVGTREIARAFGAKNADRAALKRMLRELADQGEIERYRKRVHHAGTLPSVVLADITGRDRDGELLARPTEWDEATHGAPPAIRIVTPRRARPGEIAGVGDRALLRVEQTGEGENTGRVIKLIDRAKHRVLGIFRGLPSGGGRLVPIDKKQLGRELSIPVGQTRDAEDGDLVALEVSRQGKFGLASGAVVERLGSLKTERAVSLIAIHAHGIPNVFSGAVTTEAEAARPVTLEGREDWRNVPFVTIDPPDAKDHDDAVYALPDTDPNNRGGHIVSVAIADVAYYVRPGSALDRTAVERGNSVYFPDRVVPMLPERISNDLCSLRPDQDRPALAVRMVIGADGRKRAHTFHRVLIRSAARLHYEQAQLAVSGRTDDTTAPIAEKILEPLYAAYRAVRHARDERAPLDLELPERKIVLKSDGTVDRVIMPQRLEAHRLIEEFMILANVAAAETCERARVPLIYRVHDEPSPEKLNALREFLMTLDISLPKGGALRPDMFNQILQRMKGRDVERLINEVVLRSQAQAEYSAENFGHFGLNLRRYAHFTSPIRRYADLIVHRSLIRALKLGSDGLPEIDRHTRAFRNRGQYLGDRTPRHESRARNRRPPDRAFSGGPRRRDLRRAYFRGDARGFVRRTGRNRGRWSHTGTLYRRGIFPFRRAGPVFCRQQGHAPTRRSGNGRTGRGSAGRRRVAFPAGGRAATQRRTGWTQAAAAAKNAAAERAERSPRRTRQAGQARQARQARMNKYT